jgi:hypothetical protein
VNDKLAKEFQRRYLEGERGALSGLYAECRHIAYILAKAYCKKHGLFFTDEKIDDAVQAALSRIIARFNPGPYEIRSFYQVIHIEIVHELSNGHGPKAELLNGILSLETVPEQAGAEGEPIENKRGYFNDILSGPNGSRIIVDLWRYRVYREAVLSIGGYCTRGFIRNNAERLASIWRVMHGKDTYHVQSGRRGDSGDKEADSGHKHLPSQGGKTHPVRCGKQNADYLE